MMQLWLCTQRTGGGWNVSDVHGTVLYFPHEEDAVSLCDILNKNRVDSVTHAVEFEKLIDIYVVPATHKHVRV